MPPLCVVLIAIPGFLAFGFLVRAGFEVWLRNLELDDHE